MQQLGWNTLEVRRNQARAVMMYRTVDGMIAIPASLYLTPNTRNTRRHGCKFRVPAGCVDAFNYSFFPTTIRIWNQLPNDIVLSPSIEAFKSRLTGTSATQTSINILFYLHVLSRFYQPETLELPVASSTSCTSAMHDIAQLWGLCIIGFGRLRQTDGLMQQLMRPPIARAAQWAFRTVA